MAQGSGWNSFFHQNNAYDTSSTDPVAGTTSHDGVISPSRKNSQRTSYFQLREEAYDYDATNDIPLNVQAKNAQDVERGSGYPNIDQYSTNPDSPTYWNASNTQTNGNPIPSAPLASDVSLYRDGGTEYGDTPRGSFGVPGVQPYSKQIENDEALALEVYQNETDRISRAGTNSYLGGPPSDPREKGTGVNPLTDPKFNKQSRNRKKWRPWFTWTVSVIQVILIIFELLKNQETTGSLFADFSSNPTLGPSGSTLILTGARFAPCMRVVPALPDKGPCPNNTKTSCDWSEVCGLGGFHGKKPNQWYRFIIPIFLHGGLIHIALNLIVQLQTGGSVERDIGPFRFSLIYMASGIFGFVFGGNFSSPLTPSVGASGAIFGIIGILLLELIQNWRRIINPCWELTKLLLVIIFSFLFGLLPGVDNFSHIGGFVMGIITGLVLMPTIDFSKLHKRANWVFRIVAFPVAIILFAVLITNFYSGDPSKKCPWCKHLSCLPINGWCDEVGLQNTTSTSGNGN